MESKAQDEVKITVRISAADDEALERLVKNRKFMNKSDAIRTAIRQLIDKYEQSVTPRQVVEHPEKKAVLEAEQR